MKKFFVFSFFTLNFSLVLLGQQVLSSEVSPHPEVHQERLERVNKVIQDFVIDNKIIGAVALVSKDGKLLIHRGYGLDDRSTGKKMEKDAIFRIASQTKALTSVGIMMLMESGALLLSDPVHKFIHTFKSSTCFPRKMIFQTPYSLSIYTIIYYGNLRLTCRERTPTYRTALNFASK
jgi:CubicO group peptidase (beta-lactamase class C family)